MGFVTEKRDNRRKAARLFLLYLLAFQLIGALVLTPFLLIFDPGNTIITNLTGYALRYALPVAGGSALIFGLIYRGHATHVLRKHHIRPASRSQEARFVRIAELQCTNSGIRLPRFGIIDSDALNALTVGEGPKAGLIAVTSGLLAALDDDELACVIAHEAAHIRNGDTAVLAANHAMMRTAVNLQVNNALRIADWRQGVIILAMPFALPVFLIGGMITILAMQLAWTAQRDIDQARDAMADGDAVRFTHFPEALISAIDKMDGRGSFATWQEAHGLLFEFPHGNCDSLESRAKARIAVLTRTARSMTQEARQRRDTRPAAPRVFGRQASVQPVENEFRRWEDAPVMPSFFTMLTDWNGFWQRHTECVDWYQWRRSENRNIFGLRPIDLIPFAAISMFLVVYHFPMDGDIARFGRVFDPRVLVAMAEETAPGTFCYSSSAPGKTSCDDSSRQGAASRTTAGPSRNEVQFFDPRQVPITLSILSLYLLVLMIPALRRRIFPEMEKMRTQNSRFW